LLTILPFWGWAAGGVHQTPIPHPTRTNYLFDFGTQAVFFWQVYGVTPALALYGLIRGQRRRLWALAAIALFLGSLALGGTPPLPPLLFRSPPDCLPYARFALWPAVLPLPLTGVALAWLLARSGRLPRLAAGGFLATLGLVAAYDAVANFTDPGQTT